MRRCFTILLLASCVIHGQQIYDVLLKGGHVIDPANHRDAQLDIAVIGAKIAQVARDLQPSHARVVVDVSGLIVTPGLIDLNVHLGSSEAGDRLRPDYNTLPSGVTTAVDTGSATCKTLPDFQKNVVNHARTRILAFLAATDDAECTAQAVRQFKGTLVGIVASAQTSAVALAAARASGTLIMADSGLLSNLRPGDITTNIYSRTAPAAQTLAEARKRGVLLDAASGPGGLWFRIAQPAIAQKLLPDSISSGMDRSNIVLPRANMSTAMSRFLNMGMAVNQIVERVTSNAAHALRRPELGTLNEGAIADIAVLTVEDGKFGFLDSGHVRLEAQRRVRCVLTIRNGAIVWDSDGLSIPDTTKAGPYSNFK